MKIITTQQCLEAYHAEQKRKQEEWDATLPTRVSNVFEKLISNGEVLTSDIQVVELFREHGYRITQDEGLINSRITIKDEK